MNADNFNGLSFRDIQLGNQINQVLNEYDLISKKITESKKNIIPGLAKLNNYKNKLDYKRNAHISPFIPKKIGEFSNPHSLYRDFKRNNIYTNRENETFLGTNNLIEEFKDTLEKSQIIKDDLMKSCRKSSRKHKKKSKNYNLNKTPVTYKKNLMRPFDNSMYNINTFEYNNILTGLDDEDSKNSNGGIYIPNGQNINGGLNNNIPYRKYNINTVGNTNLNDDDNNYFDLDSNKKGKKDLKKLEHTRDTIIRAYQKIKKENRILEVEINNYKRLTNQYLNFGNNYNMKYKNFSQKRANEYMQSLQKIIESKCKTIDSIINIQKQNETLNNKVNSLSKKNKIIFQKIEQRNRKNAEIQILNEENEQKIIYLEDEKNSLIKDLEKYKIVLMNLKNKEHNLNMLNESNKKLLQDKEEHILKLKNTIDQFNKYKNNNLMNNKNNYAQNKIQFMNNMKLYEQKINNLKLEINNLNSNKQKALVYKSNLQKKLYSLQPNTMANLNEKQLIEQLNLLKKENEQKTIYLQEKSNQIEILKNAYDSLATAMKNNNLQEAIQKNNVMSLIKGIDMTDNLYNNDQYQIINSQIQQNLEKNLQKTNELEELSQKFQNIVNQKDEIIKNLELKVKQLNLNSQLYLAQSIDNNNLFSKLQVNSINELTLDEGQENTDINNINNLNDQIMLRNKPLNMQENININDENDMNLNMNEDNDIKDLDNDNEEIDLQNNAQIQFNQEDDMNNDNLNDLKNYNQYIQLNQGKNNMDNMMQFGEGQVEEGELLPNGEEDQDDEKGELQYINNFKNYNYNDNGEEQINENEEEGIDENEEIQYMQNNMNEDENQNDDMNEIKELDEDEDNNGEEDYGMNEIHELGDEDNMNQQENNYMNEQNDKNYQDDHVDNSEEENNVVIKNNPNELNDKNINNNINANDGNIKDQNLNNENKVIINNEEQQIKNDDIENNKNDMKEKETNNKMMNKNIENLLDNNKNNLNQNNVDNNIQKENINQNQFNINSTDNQFDDNIINEEENMEMQNNGNNEESQKYLEYMNNGEEGDINNMEQFGNNYEEGNIEHIGQSDNNEEGGEGEYQIEDMNNLEHLGDVEEGEDMLNDNLEYEQHFFDNNGEEEENLHNLENMNNDGEDEENMEGMFMNHENGEMMDHDHNGVEGEEHGEDEYEINMDAHFNNYGNENEANFEDNAGGETNEEEGEQDIDQFNEIQFDNENH